MRTVFIFAVLLMLGFNPAFAEHEQTPGTNADASANHENAAKAMMMDPAQMTPEQKVMHERMMAYTTPTENHDVLKSMAGSWKADVTFWMDPNAEPTMSQGTSEAKMIMDGRFLEQTFHGSFMGQPFEGRGIYGYDNMRKEYTGLWFDSMATGIMISSAQYDPATKKLAEEGSMSCPVTNETHRKYRAVTTLIDADHYTYETYMTGPDGQEYRSMLISYSRVQ